jgi:adenylosuccinate lyase
MALSELTAIGPVDGRYATKTRELSPYFSEFALIRYRLRVEVEYFLALVDLGLPQLEDLPDDAPETIRALVDDFTEREAAAIKEIEKTTNHDVKAVEYWMKERFTAIGLGEWMEFIHFGLTSQDINNTAVPMAIKAACRSVYQPAVRDVISRLDALSKEWWNIPMLARTHGQPASPTRLGKEVRVFVDRLESQFSEFNALPHSGKFGGATGNFNAHHAAYPDIDWPGFGNVFLSDYLSLERQQWTTQIEQYDGLAARFDNMKRINTILIDLCRDLWQYIAMNYFQQRVEAGEVGSSAMPHKVNPIDFENAEGNLGLANALLEHLSAKLPVSRLQRDLTDSTVSRSIGVPFAHTLIALRAIRKGLDKLTVNKAALHTDLDQNWAVLAEAIQTILRREFFPEPYEKLKALTRTGEKVTPALLKAFIQELDVAPEVKDELFALRPDTYIGMP